MAGDQGPRATLIAADHSPGVQSIGDSRRELDPDPAPLQASSASGAAVVHLAADGARRFGLAFGHPTPSSRLHAGRWAAPRIRTPCDSPPRVTSKSRVTIFDSPNSVLIRTPFKTLVKAAPMPWRHGIPWATVCYMAARRPAAWPDPATDHECRKRTFSMLALPASDRVRARARQVHAGQELPSVTGGS